MKSIIKVLLAFCLLVNINLVQGQIIITSGDEISPEDLVNNIVGEGVQFSNVQYQGAELAKGIFTNGYSTNIGIDGGIILCAGYASTVQGPNFGTGNGASMGTPGDATLTGMAGQSTFDAAVLQFDLIPESDTLRFKYVFGSEEYDEYVFSQFNDVFGYFITGPNPDGGEYANKNIAVVPGTNPGEPININTINWGQAWAPNPPPGPDFGVNPEYYISNNQGLTIEYDGFTTVLIAWVKVVPNETYHIKLAIADVGDDIIDSGVCLQENSLSTSFYAECYSFGFDTLYNPELLYSVSGELINDSVFIAVPNNTNLTNLIADYILSPGAIAFVGGTYQQSGITPNDFTYPVTYTVVDQNGNEKDWLVIVDFETGQKENKATGILIYPNPAKDIVSIRNANGFNLTLVNIQGLTLLQKQINDTQYSINVSRFEADVYFLKFENDEKVFVRKIVVEK